jgi:UDP-N-acetylmuramate: L-alanyl-gamma-D-glutamyl-meso-diaminopimelate ligase
MCPGSRTDIKILEYGIPPHYVENEVTYLTQEGKIPLRIFGTHNLMNLNGARLVCNQLGISDKQFFEAIQSFKGASKRLEVVGSDKECIIYKDFAHAPSKVLATLTAVRQQYPNRKLIACLELHTYSSLSKEFMILYAGTLDQADVPIVYYNPHALMLKRLPDIKPEQIIDGFGNKKIEVFNDSEKLYKRLHGEAKENAVFLMMSSGNYDGIDLKSIIAKS